MNKMGRKSIKKTSTINENNWKKVKITGNLISDDGGFGLEGLIGLEVLEDYDKNIVSTSNNKRKYLQDTESDDSDVDIEVNRKKKKKLKKQKQKSKLTSDLNKREDDKVTDKPINQITIDDNKLQENLSAWNGFGIPSEILKALAEKRFNQPTEIQRLTLPPAILCGKDILGAAETGSGKTLAFGIPILSGILHMKKTEDLVKPTKVKKTIQSKNITINIIRKTTKLKNRNDRDNLTPPPEEIDNFPDFTSENDVDDDDSNNEEEHPDNDKSIIHSKLSLTDDHPKPLYALILTPTRELAVQIRDHLVAVAKYIDINIAVIFGGLAAVKQERVLRKCPEIVVATPGRLWELINEGNEHLNKLDNIKFFVIDETDRMLEKGHFDELKLLLERLNANPNKIQRQNFVFSATLTLFQEQNSDKSMKRNKKKIKILSSKQKLQLLIDQLGMIRPEIVDITKKVGTAQTLTECRIQCDLQQKDLYLYYFLKCHPGRTIVFCNSVDCVKRLTTVFQLLQCQPKSLHAHMNQKQRLKNLEKFTENPTALLIATDVAARGLDIPNIQHVIHYQVPRTTENYIHRSGRTARANLDGIAVLIVEPSEMKTYLNLCNSLGRTEGLPLFPVSTKLLQSVRERLNIARDIDVLELRIKREQSERGWLKKAAKEMDILIDDKSDLSDSDSEFTNHHKHIEEAGAEDDDDDIRLIEKSKLKQLLRNKRIHLNKLLNQSIFPKGYSYKYPTSSGTLQIPSTTMCSNFPIDAVHHHQVRAVDVMKNAIVNYKTEKKQKNKKK